jgi:hypothetical protein
MDFKHNSTGDELQPFRDEEEGSNRWTLQSIEEDEILPFITEHAGKNRGAMPEASYVYLLSMPERDGESGVEADDDANPATPADRANIATANKEIWIDTWFQDLQAYDESNGATIVDPTLSERCYWTDPITKIQRMVWRPGKLFLCRLVRFCYC